MIYPRIEFRSRCIRGSSSAVNSRFASSATRRTSSIVTPDCPLIKSLPLHYKVYLGYLDPGDSCQLALQMNPHALHLLQPGSVANLQMDDPVHVVHDGAALRHRSSASNQPCG